FSTLLESEHETRQQLAALGEFIQL
ncbi:MAG: hypothetical protein JWM03_1065, partial [Rhodocyclales bacterium]|nr:hypothetical protein [Rhodocyclales bacterium]